MSDNYFDTNLKKDCNGCGVCAFICPKKAITMMKDAEGFEYPVIDKNKCIDCGLCKRKCPNRDYLNNNISKAYISYNNSEKILQTSSSGGMFFSLAKEILNNEGIVIGVAFDENLNAKHECITKVEELRKLQGSKYVRSDLNDCYEKAINYLKKGKKVFFTGTPCQCSAIRALVNNKIGENLYTCEIICHANPSPLVFDLYKSNIEKEYKKKILDIEFRSKKNGWKNQTPIIYFDDGSTLEENSYFFAFVRELINRPSCYNCHFSSSNRLSDFTIGDIWGISEINREIVDNDTGLSLFCINTEKGNNLFNSIIDEYTIFDVDKELAFSYNHNSNLKFHKKRNKFFKLLATKEINENNIIKYLNKYTKLSVFFRLKRKIKSILKKNN